MQKSTFQSRHAEVDPNHMDDSSDFTDLNSDDATITQASLSYVNVAKPDKSRFDLLN